MSKTKPKSTKLNVNLLRKIQAAILEEPKRMNMNDFINTNFGSGWLHTKAVQKNPPACGTVGCIAGWAVLLSQPRITNKTIKSRAEKLVMENNEEESKSIPRRAANVLNLGKTDLFYPEEWPHDWAMKLMDHNPGTKAYAKVVSEYIDYYVNHYPRKRLK